MGPNYECRNCREGIETELCPNCSECVECIDFYCGDCYRCIDCMDTCGVCDKCTCIDGDYNYKYLRHFHTTCLKTIYALPLSSDIIGEIVKYL
jgi:hypothetical protein